ncbi:hypothetical protein THAOC_00253, partial [Thalassiosira oceanica]
MIVQKSHLAEKSGKIRRESKDREEASKIICINATPRRTCAERGLWVPLVGRGHWMRRNTQNTNNSPGANNNIISSQPATDHDTATTTKSTKSVTIGGIALSAHTHASERGPAGKRGEIAENRDQSRLLGSLA